MTGARKQRNRGKIVTAFMMGSRRLYDFVERQPDGRDALGRLHQRHPRHPLVHHDDRDQLGHRGRPDRSGRGRLDRLPDLQRGRRPDGLRARRGAGGRRPGDHRPALDGRRGHGLADHRRRWPAGPAWSPPGPTSGRSSPSGAWPSCSAGASASGPPPSSRSPTPTTAIDSGRRRTDSVWPDAGPAHPPAAAGRPRIRSSSSSWPIRSPVPASCSCACPPAPSAGPTCRSRPATCRRTGARSCPVIRPSAWSRRSAATSRAGSRVTGLARPGWRASTARAPSVGAAARTCAGWPASPVGTWTAASPS